MPGETKKEKIEFPLNGQDTEPVKNIPFGRRNIGKSGCGVLAVCNALWILGRDVDFYSVKDWFEKHGTVLGAIWGVHAGSVAKYLERQGLEIWEKPKRSTYDTELGKADCAVMLYWWRRGKNCGGHFVALRKSEEGILIYNLYRNSKQAYRFLSVDEFLHKNYKKAAMKVYFLAEKNKNGST